MAVGLLAVLLFLLAVRLLGAATTTAAPILRPVVDRLASGDAAAVGLGWLLTYGVTNGSVVAAVGVTLAGAGVVEAGRVLGVVAGSRLGAAAFVILVGGLDHLRRRRRSLRSSLGLGVLTFVVSHAVYIPAIVLGYWALPALGPVLGGWSRHLDPTFLEPGLVHHMGELLVGFAGPGPVALGTGVALFAAVALFDRALRGLDVEAVRSRISFRRPWVMFGAGMGVTAVTASVSFSIGVLVPVFNRGGITRREIVPYVLGANVATLLDTLLVALVLQAWTAAGAILTLMVAAIVVAGALVLGYSTFYPRLEQVLGAVTRTRTGFAAFLISLLVAPALLLLIP